MRYYIINTNRKANPTGEDEFTMINEEIVAAYSLKGCNGIKRLKKGDTVFLYRVREGIIASGIVCSDFFERKFRGTQKIGKSEFYRKLRDFKKIDKPISAEELRKITNSKRSFRHTAFTVNEFSGRQIVQAIQKRLKYNKAA